MALTGKISNLVIRILRKKSVYLIIGVVLAYCIISFLMIGGIFFGKTIFVVISLLSLLVAFMTGYLIALLRSHYSATPIQAALINSKRAIYAATLGFIVTTLMPLLVSVAVASHNREPFRLEIIYSSFCIGLLGGLIVFWVFLGLDIKSYLDYRFGQLATHSALWTDGGSFERVLDNMRSFSQANKSWIYSKFISRKLGEDFQEIGPSTIRIKEISVTAYSHLLSTLIAESQEHIHMTCPLRPDKWLEAVYPECRRCRYSEEKRGEPTKEVEKGECIISCDPSIVREGDEVFDSSQRYKAEDMLCEKPTIINDDWKEIDCRLRERDVDLKAGLPRHLRAVNLSLASPDEKLRLISSRKKWQDKPKDECLNTFFAIHRLIGNMQLLEFQHDLYEHCRRFYKDLSKEPLEKGYFDYNILDGILIGFVQKKNEMGLD